jgi:hypothetical protein
MLSDSTADEVKENEMVRTCSMLGGMRNAYILVRKTEGKRPLERPRCRWEDNIRMDLREIGLEGVDWMHLAYDMDQLWALVNVVMNLQVP